MATVTRDVDIRATPAQILEVLADLPSYPLWSAVHRSAKVDTTGPDGMPARASMAVSALGLVDEQVLDYRWTDHGVSWTLVSSGQQREQQGGYELTDRGAGVTRVSYRLDITPAVPAPGLLVKQVMKKAVTSATDGLRARVESLV